MAGGTASVLSGGKFANGAITGAMAHLFNWEAHQVAKATAEVAATAFPGVGEPQDIYVIAHPNSALWERGLAGISLVANVLTGGLLPNAGGFIRGAGHLGDDVIHVTKSGVALPSDAKYAIPSRYSENPYR